MNEDPQVQDQSLDSNSEQIPSNLNPTVDGGSGATEVRSPESMSPTSKGMPQLGTSTGRQPQDSMHKTRASIDKRTPRNSSTNGSAEESKTGKKPKQILGLESK